MRNRVRKSRARALLSEGDVSTVFDDKCIGKLASLAKLPANADIKAFAAGVREAAQIFTREAQIPNANELHSEISELHDAAERRRYDQAANLLANLSPRAREMVMERAVRPSLKTELPSAEALRDVRRREAACAKIATLCRIGGRLVPGRRRPGGKQSRPVMRPLLYAPEPRRNFSRRDAERDFVMWLSIAYYEATGTAPARTARH